MLKKKDILTKLEDCGVIAVVRAESAEMAIKIVEACVAGGIVGIEITFTVPGAIDIIAALAKRYKPEEVIIGAGTVLDSETARAAILAGAHYVVLPCLNADTVKTCLRYQVPCMAGAMTPKEVVDCMEAGADIIKIFPAALFGPSIIKNFKGPLPQAQMMPTGGVNVGNVADWINADAVMVGSGSDLTTGAKKGDFESITRLAKEMVEAVRVARGK